MNDTRAAQARALVDDARSLVVDLLDDLGPDEDWQPTHWLKEARTKLNSALQYLEKIQ